jgi:hypothetical protein
VSSICSVSNIPIVQTPMAGSPLWCGQAVALGRDLPVGEATKKLAAEAQALLRRLAGL